MQQAIVEQHRFIESLLEGARAALAGGDGEAMTAAVAALREAFEAHFELEERLYHPPLLELQPEHAAALRSIAEGHERLLGQLAAILERVGARGFAGARTTFAELSLDFAAHEAAEEGLFHALDPR